MEPKGTEKYQTTSGFYLTKRDKNITEIKWMQLDAGQHSKTVVRFPFPSEEERHENIRQISYFLSLSSTSFGRHDVLGS